MILLSPGTLPWQCRLCSDAFKEPVGLRRHMTSRHDGLPGFSCSGCDALFEYQVKLRQHRKTCEKAQVRIQEPAWLLLSLLVILLDHHHSLGLYLPVGPFQNCRYIECL